MGAQYTFLIKSSGDNDKVPVDISDTNICTQEVPLESIQRILSEAGHHASNYRVVIPSIDKHVKEEAIIRNLIIEYPEVNFYFQEVDWRDILLEKVNQDLCEEDIALMTEICNLLVDPSNKSKSRYQAYEKEHSKAIDALKRKDSLFEDLINRVNNGFYAEFQKCQSRLKKEDSSYKIKVRILKLLAPEEFNIKRWMEFKFEHRREISSLPQFYHQLIKVVENGHEEELRLCELHLSIMRSDKSFHYFNGNREQLAELLDRENLFDASNLRFAVKQYIFNEKKVKSNNAHILDSRAKHIAYVVDEESVQCRQLSYCLYANGMRAFPVSTKTLLTYASKQWKGQHDKIILRDFDLQFKDEDQGGNITREHGYCETDFIRGYKYNSTTKRWENLISETYCSFDDCAISCDYNPYWHKEDLKYTYCISQGYSGLVIVNSNRCDGWNISDDKKSLKVPGVKKPVSGIYKELTEYISPIKKCFLHKFQDTDIDLKRINREHSTPLGLYDIALNIFRRAECYLNEQKFVKAAVLSQEAIEILNGYHTSLFLQAYHVHALAENAIAMNMLGCDETSMAEDCKIRIDIVRQNISRMLRHTTFESKNILNQIYADCRQYCHEKEHFQSEEVFIDAMAKLNDGTPLLNLYKKTKLWIQNRG